MNPAPSSSTSARPRRKRSGWRRLLLCAAALVTLLLAGGGWVAYQHTYDLREEPVTITGGAQPLKGVLALPPEGRGPFGLVVFVHGDGPIDATHETFYRPAWESLARAGYASLSWNKPGLNGAPGNWLHQSMEDRAEETADAIAWAKTRKDIDPDRIGLWGASQAGWVLPKVAARMPELRFVIAVSPAINWLRQGRYNLLAELRAENASQQEIDAAVARSDRTRELLRKGATFEQYRAAVGDVNGMTPDRWRFILANHTSDASEDLAKMRAPVLLMLGGHDLNVDVADTEKTYRKLLRRPGQLRVRHYPDATHSLVPKDVEDSELKAFALAVAAPRSLSAEGYLEDLRRYVTEIDSRR
ncbi:serine aminopeptidase domain-containing protein [Planomonospora sp. ID67723]|uniref:alpha/beta hydrolase family protein n=1 Tax=Planomonospora sp. ID67723 TaxID=2738134 RepID=UPI0027DAC959|nr:alpha/beta hydrolase [Planomonospora sp. ID67723]